MKKFFKCLFGGHEYEVLKEYNIQNVRGETIGTVIVSRCSNCGKITETRIYTTDCYQI